MHGLKNFCSKSFVLAVCKFSGAHTAEAIAMLIRKIIADWKIDIKICHGIITDGAANMKAVISYLIIHLTFLIKFFKGI